MKNISRTLFVIAAAAFALAALNGCTAEEKADTSKVVPIDKAPGKLESDSGAGGAGKGATPPPVAEQAQTKP